MVSIPNIKHVSIIKSLNDEYPLCFLRENAHLISVGFHYNI